MIIRPRRGWFTQVAAMGGGAAAPAFDPLTLFSGGEEGGWWDWGDAAVNFTDAGSTAVTTGGDLIYQTNDKSGNANHFTQPTSTSRPAWQAPRALFADGGSADGMFTGAISTTISGSDLTCFAVFTPVGTVNFGRIIGGTDSGGVDTSAPANASFILRSSTSGNFTAYRGGTLSAGALSNSTDYIVESVFDGANHTLTVNGTGQSPAASTGSFAIDRFFVGLQGGSAADANIAEIIIVNRELTGPETTGLRAYLNDKWSVY